MQHDIEDRQSPRSRRMFRIVLGLLALGIALAIGIAALLMVGRHKVSSRIDAIRARGEPVLPTEISFEASDSSSDFHTKGAAFDSAFDASADFRNVPAGFSRDDQFLY